MRFFTRTTPTVLPCAAHRGGSVASVTIGGAPARSSAAGASRGRGRAKSSPPKRAMLETPWEF